MAAMAHGTFEGGYLDRYGLPPMLAAFLFNQDYLITRFWIGIDILTLTFLCS